jgi:hypothetical protein
VHDGYVLTKSVSRSPIGGRLLNSCLQKAMEARGNQLRPRQTFTRVEKKGFPGEFDVSALEKVYIRAWLLRLSHQCATKWRLKATDVAVLAVVDACAHAGFQICLQMYTWLLFDK